MNNLEINKSKIKRDRFQSLKCVDYFIEGSLLLLLAFKMNKNNLYRLQSFIMQYML